MYHRTTIRPSMEPIVRVWGWRGSTLPPATLNIASTLNLHTDPDGVQVGAAPKREARQPPPPLRPPLPTRLPRAPRICQAGMLHPYEPVFQLIVQVVR